MLLDPFGTNSITNTIIGSAIRVHRATGPGLLESVYLPCLRVELQQSGLTVAAGYRADMIVDDKVIVELKAVEALAPIHKAQMLTYLKLSGKPTGLLINFNVPILKDGVQRVFNPAMLKCPGPSDEHAASTGE
jgi:GxxExxY protein